MSRSVCHALRVLLNSVGSGAECRADSRGRLPKFGTRAPSVPRAICVQRMRLLRFRYCDPLLRRCSAFVSLLRVEAELHGPLALLLETCVRCAMSAWVDTQLRCPRDSSCQISRASEQARVEAR